MSDRYQVKYQKSNSSSISTTHVSADSASQAKEKVKASQTTSSVSVKIISAVKE